MFARKFVTAIALVSAVTLGTSGCSLTHNVPTLMSYAPSDGTQLNLGGVDARNVIYLTSRNTDGTSAEVGALIGTFVNTTTAPLTVVLQFDEDASSDPAVTTPQTFTWESNPIPAGGKLELGYNESPALEALLLGTNGMTVQPGDLVAIKISVGDKQASLNVPALDGSLDQYAPLLQNLGVQNNAGNE